MLQFKIVPFPMHNVVRRLEIFVKELVLKRTFTDGGSKIDILSGDRILGVKLTNRARNIMLRT